MSDTPATILNVNDDEVTRYVVTKMLRSAGYHVVEATTGEEALRLVDSHPDLIVLDVQLPDINGFEVCRRIKADPDTASIAILHLSASFIGSQDEAYGLEGGADGYLTQPVESAVLLGHIKALLRMRRAEDEALGQAVQWQTTFDAIGDCIFLLDESSRIAQCNRTMADLLGQPADAVRGRPLAEVAPRALDFSFVHEAKKRPRITEVPLGGRWFRVTTGPLPGPPSGTVYVMADITDRKCAEEENIRLLRLTQESAMRERAFLRDMLGSVTDGTLRLCDTPTDLPAPLSAVWETQALDAAALPELRRVLRALAQERGFTEERWGDLLTAVGEAGMNAVVHAGGGTGRVFVDNRSGTIQVWIEDHGGGIAVDRLPQATLQRGYTTAGTLGHGFKMMLQTCDRLWLLTGPTGTTIVIEQERLGSKPPWLQAAL